MSARIEPEAGPSRIYVALLLPCMVATALGVYVTVDVVGNWDPAREYAGLAPFVIGAYFGPGCLAALAALLGLRPGTWRLALTGIAAVWSLWMMVPMYFAGGWG